MRDSPVRWRRWLSASVASVVVFGCTGDPDADARAVQDGRAGLLVTELRAAYPDLDRDELRHAVDVAASSCGELSGMLHPTAMASELASRGVSLITPEIANGSIHHLCWHVDPDTPYVVGAFPSMETARCWERSWGPVATARIFLADNHPEYAIDEINNLIDQYGPDSVEARGAMVAFSAMIEMRQRNEDVQGFDDNSFLREHCVTSYGQELLDPDVVDRPVALPLTTDRVDPPSEGDRSDTGAGILEEKGESVEQPLSPSTTLGAALAALPAFTDADLNCPEVGRPPAGRWMSCVAESTHGEPAEVKLLFVDERGGFQLDYGTGMPTSGELFDIYGFDALCRDLNAGGEPLFYAMLYWYAAGQPERMDASGIGRPCSSVYGDGQVEAFFTQPEARIDMQPAQTSGQAADISDLHAQLETDQGIALVLDCAGDERDPVGTTFYCAVEEQGAAWRDGLEVAVTPSGNLEWIRV